jgi:uncharacterized protein YcnI
VLAAAAGLLAGVLAAALLVVPVSAHVEVEADNARAGARDVRLTFTSEAESASAGIRSQRVVLPAGIAPTDVRLAKAPKGWKLSVTDDGYTVGGKALAIGTNARHSVIVARLPPTSRELVFKVIDTYGNGDVERWIEVPEKGKPEPDNPAAVLKLKAPAQDTSTANPTTSAPRSDTPAPVTLTADALVPASDEPDSNAWLWILLAALVAAAAVAATLAYRRRRGDAG